MHYWDETNILLFLVQVALLLGLARGLGEVFRRWGQPSITAEILVGVVLGPTVLGRVAPGFHAMLFPDDVTQQTMLDTVAWLGILFFLLKTGLETSLVTALRQGPPGAGDRLERSGPADGRGLPAGVVSARPVPLPGAHAGGSRGHATAHPAGYRPPHDVAPNA